MKNASSSVALCALLLAASCASERAVAPASREDDAGQVVLPYDREITVVWELRYYVIGARRPGSGFRCISEPEEDLRTEVDGFLMEIVEPPEHAGKVLMAHFDGAGIYDPFTFYKMGQRYTEKVPANAIGHIGFRTLCR